MKTRIRHENDLNGRRTQAADSFGSLIVSIHDEGGRLESMQNVRAEKVEVEGWGVGQEAVADASGS